MRRVIYETEVMYQLAELKELLLETQGASKGKRTFSEILSSLDALGMFSSVGRNIRETYQVDCPENWFLLYVHKNYFVFSKTGTEIIVLKMYNNKQDFLNHLFGIEMRSQESKDFWGE